MTLFRNNHLLKIGSKKKTIKRVVFFCSIFVQGTIFFSKGELVQRRDKQMIEQNHYGKMASPKNHDMKIINRKKLDLTGVINVESFDSEEFLLETECGFLAIRGENLHMKNLNVENGIVSIEGLVMEFVYVDHAHGREKAKGFFSKLFK